MSITFRYKTIRRPDGENIRGPWIPVTLIGPSNNLDIIAILDSGADFSVVPHEFAEIIGVDLGRGEEETCKGVGGDVDTVFTTIRAKVSRGHESHIIGLPVYFILEENTNVPPLIGRGGFFDEFKITFDQASEKIILKKVQSQRYE